MNLKVELVSKYLITFFLLIIFSTNISATTEKGDTLVIHMSDQMVTPWNEIVSADTADNGTRLHSVYELEPDGWYPMSSSLALHYDDLHIYGGKRSEGQARPRILLQLESGTWWMITAGKNITLDGIHMMQVEETIGGNIGAWARSGVLLDGENSKVVIHDCIWDHTTGFSAMLQKDGLNLRCTNSLFRFNKPTDNSVWAGQGIDISSIAIDTAIIQNCTWYGGGPFMIKTLESAEAFFKMDHCTIVDFVQYPINGYHWVNAEFTNNLFYNAYTMGEDSDQVRGQDPEELPFGIINVDTIYADSFGNILPAESSRNIFVSNNNNFISQNIKDYWAVAKSDPVKYHEFRAPDPTFYDGFMNSRTQAMFADDATWPWLVLENTTSEDPQFENYFDYSDTLINYSKYFYSYAWPNAAPTTFMKDPDGEPLVPTDPMIYNLRITNSSLRTASITGGPIGDLTWELPNGYNSILAGSPNDVTSLRIIAPNGEEKWQIGSNQNISWSSNKIDNVKIEYSIDNGINWTTIVSSIPASYKSYNWAIPNITSNICKIRISSTDDESVFDESNNTFSIVKPKELEVSYNFNGNSIDVTGNANDLENRGAQLTTDRFGVQNSAYMFDGIDDYMFSVNQINWNDLSNKLTVSIWISPYSFRDQEHPLGNLLNNSEFRADIENWFSFGIGQISEIDQGPFLEIWDADYGITGIFADESHQELYKWYNIVFKRDSDGSFYMFQNGKIAYESNSIEKLSDGISKLFLGANNSAFEAEMSYYFHGKIDDVKIYNYALTNGEIIDLYTENGWEGNKDITITTPNGSELWEVGSEQKIIWNSISVKNVSVDLSIDNGTSWSNIFQSIDASLGSVIWTVPDILSEECKIKIYDIDNPSIADTSDSLFTISEKAALVLTTPNGGEVLKANSQFEITWTSNDVELIDIEYAVSRGDWQVIGSNILASDSSFIWTVPEISSNECQIRISDISSLELNDYNDVFFTIINPKLTLVSPNGGEEWIENSTQQIVWIKNDVESVDVYYSTNSGSDWIVIDTAVSNESNTLEWQVPNILSNQYLVKIVDQSDSVLIDLSDNNFEVVGDPVGVNNISSVPTEYILFDNYPNPFNPTTNIKFGIPEQSRVSVMIFTSLGEKITTLMDREQSAGYYEVSFDASHLSSGIYLYQLKTNDFISTKKMLLVK